MTTEKPSLNLFSDSSALSLVSLLLITGAASISLLHAAEDQTGRAVSEISSAFRAASGQARESLVGAKGAEREDVSEPLNVPDHGSRGPARNSKNWLAERRLESRPDDEEPDRTPIDRESDVFRNFLSELRRFSRCIATESLSGGVSFEIVAPDETTDEDLAVQAADVLRQACSGWNVVDIECELTLWSSSPTPSAWIRAAVEAEQFRSRVVSLAMASGISAPKITSCSRLWPDPAKTRPAATMVLRLAKH